jgi:hypothetical protein
MTALEGADGSPATPLLVATTTKVYAVLLPRPVISAEVGGGEPETVVDATGVEPI